MKPLRVGVVGVGSAGQSAALFLRRSGHNVHVYERVEKPQPVGAGFLLQPTAFVVLKRLGIFDHIHSRGAQIDRLLGRTSTLKPVLDLHYHYLDSRLHGLGLFRGTLFSALLKQIEAEAIPVHDHVDVVDVVQHPSDNTASLLASDGTKHGPFDLVIVANGSRSALRDKLHSKWTWRVSPYGWGTLYAIVPDVGGHFLSQRHLYQYFKGTDHMLGILPTGYASNTDTDPLVTLFWSLHRDHLDRWNSPDTSLTQWKQEVLALTPTVQPILDQIQSKAQLIFASYLDVRMNSYHNPETNNIVFIGDAAHAMSPVLGQGVNMALTDSWLLSEAIRTAPDLKHALKEYTAMRKSPLNYYQWISMIANPWFQSSRIPGVALSRDNLFHRASSAFKFVQKQLVLTLSGAKSGFLSGNHVPTSSHINYRFWDHP